MNRNMLNRGAILTLILLIFFAIDYYKKDQEQVGEHSFPSQVEEAFTNQQSNIQVQGQGSVVKLLRDDLQGAKHQKFIVRVAPKLTILISHNIDLAPRVNSLSTGGEISFNGEYEWNQKGGVVHWTHHDPQKRHPDGWLKYKGKIYQ